MPDCRYVADCKSRGPEFDPGLVPYFVEIDHEIISTAILVPSADSRRVVVCYKRKYVHEVLVNHLIKLAQENVYLGELTVPTLTGTYSIKSNKLSNSILKNVFSIQAGVGLDANLQAHVVSATE